MNIQELRARAVDLYGSMNPYDDTGHQREEAAEQAAREAGVSRANLKFAVRQILAGWQDEVKAAPEVFAEPVEKPAPAAPQTPRCCVRKSLEEIGAEIHGLCGAASRWFFGCYSGSGRLVACPAGKPEVLVGAMQESYRGESAAEFGKYEAWGCALGGETLRFWVATLQGVRVLAEWKARQWRVSRALEKAAELRKAREAKEKKARMAHRS